MTRHFVPTVHVRQMIARRKFQQGMQLEGFKANNLGC